MVHGTIIRASYLYMHRMHLALQWMIICSETGIFRVEACSTLKAAAMVPRHLTILCPRSVFSEIMT